MIHIALFGDSIIDNEVYVHPGKTVIEALRRELGSSALAIASVVAHHDFATPVATIYGKRVL